jgi:arylsulfatase A-like enzyme
MSPEEARKLELLYQADVFYADQQIGRLLDFFAEAGLEEDSLTVITADHGEVLGDVLTTLRYGFDHGEFLLPGEIQSPLWLRAPAAPAGTHVDGVVETRALFGSMLWAAGVETELDATRLPGFGATAPVDSGVAFVTRRSFSSKRLPIVLQGERYAMVTAGSLLVCTAGASEGVELFDLAEDPTGVSNLAARDPRETADLERILERWWQEHVSDTEPSPQQVDEDLREQLRSLGYVQ